MPDWSYRTVFRPVLFRMPGLLARDLTLGAMGLLARMPLGPAVIDFLGHMGPSDRLRTTVIGIPFPSPVGLGCGVDVHALALPALSRFGFGFVEVGPVSFAPRASADDVRRDLATESLVMADPPRNPGFEALARRLEGGPKRAIPRLARLVFDRGADCETVRRELRPMMARLADLVDIFVLSVGPGVAPGPLMDLAREVAPTAPVLLHVPPDPALGDDEDRLERWAEAGVRGVLIDGPVKGPSAREPTLATVRTIRRAMGEAFAIACSGGVHSPEDALGLREAGADLVEVDSGLVFSGPGLPKRANEAILFARENSGSPAPIAPPLRAAEASWFWTLLMGLGMLGGGVLALAIASTRVMLPYDEGFVTLTLPQIHAINDHLLRFLAHDRVTLAGVMMTLGVLYIGLSLLGSRRGRHWAKVAVVWSASIGFASFFLFLGFGYFDPFHAFVTAILFQLLLLGVHSRLDPPRGVPAPDLDDGWRWRLGQWGQLAFVVQASAFLTAGAVIAGVGITRVFVPEDLEFLGTSAEAIRAAHPRLVPLIAHDRAMLGGMLVASGTAFLLAALWGFRRGEGWLWWTFLLAGIPGYGAAIAVHMVVGYHNLKHLAPAFAGLGLFAAGLGLSSPWLCGDDPRSRERWRRHLAPGGPRGAEDGEALAASPGGSPVSR